MEFLSEQEVLRILFPKTFVRKLMKVMESPNEELIVDKSYGVTRVIFWAPTKGLLSVSTDGRATISIQREEEA